MRRMEANVMCEHFNFCDALRKEKKNKAKRRIGAGTQCSDKTAASVVGTQSFSETFQDGFVVAAPPKHLNFDPSLPQQRRQQTVSCLYARPLKVAEC